LWGQELDLLAGKAKEAKESEGNCPALQYRRQSNVLEKDYVQHEVLDPVYEYVELSSLKTINENIPFTSPQT